MADIYGATALTGGGATALDSIDGADLSDGDAATVITDAGVYWYHLNATSAATENSPFRIAPDSNAGDKRWHLVGTTAFIGATLSLTSDFSLSAASGVSIQWANEDEDVGGWFSSGANTRLTVPEGVTRVQVFGSALGQSETDQFVLKIEKNGVNFTGNEVDTSGSEVISIATRPVTVVEDDYFTLWAYSTEARDITASDETYFAIQAVGFA